MPDFIRNARPTTLLRHELPNGTHHFDWLLARDDDGPLLTFRTDRDISRDNDPFDAERIPDHRRAYLAYEGPVSGGRGRVVRVASGWCMILTESDQKLVVHLEVGLRSGFWVGRPLAGEIFGFAHEISGSL